MLLWSKWSIILLVHAYLEVVMLKRKVKYNSSFLVDKWHLESPDLPTREENKEKEVALLAN